MLDASCGRCSTCGRKRNRPPTSVADGGPCIDSVQRCWCVGRCSAELVALYAEAQGQILPWCRASVPEVESFGDQLEVLQREGAS